MSNYYVGRNVSKLDKSPALDPYTKVVIIVGEDEETGEQLVYEAGTDAGRTLEVNNPWGTQQMANDILAKISGYAYRPFSAEDALLPDDSDIGDTVTISGVYGVIAKQEITFDSQGASRISSPSADETENEFSLAKLRSASDRALSRKINHLNTRFVVELGKIETEIEETTTGLSSRITQTSNAITSEVSRATGAESSIRQNIDSITLSVTSNANQETSFQISGTGITAKTVNVDLHVKALNVDGDITAKTIASNDSTVSGKLMLEQGCLKYKPKGGSSNPDSQYLSTKWSLGLRSASSNDVTLWNNDGSIEISCQYSLTLSGGTGLFIDSSAYGTSLPYTTSDGRIFFLKA